MGPAWLPAAEKDGVDGVGHAFFCAMDGCYTLLLASTAGTSLRVSDRENDLMTCAGTCEEHVCLSEGRLATMPTAAPTSLWGDTADSQLARRR